MKFKINSGEKSFDDYYLEERELNRDLNESSLSRLNYYIDNFDVAFITAQKQGVEYTYKVNKSRNLDLRLALEAKGYRCFVVQGSYDNQESGETDKETSFAVVNTKKPADKFIEEMCHLGKYFDQESVLIFIDGKGKFYTTSGKFEGEIRDAGIGHYGKDAPYKSLVNGRPFVVEEITLCDKAIKTQGMYDKYKEI